MAAIHAALLQPGAGRAAIWRAATESRCKNSPAERELGISFRAARTTLADTVAGLRALGRWRR